MSVWLWTLGAAWAQEAPSTPDEPAPAEPADVEITVWGRLAIQQARDDVVRQIEDLGYRQVRRRNGETVFRGKYAKVSFFDDGRIKIGRVTAGLAPPPRERMEPPPRPGLPERAAPMEPGVGPWFWALPSKTKLDPIEEEILQATREDVQSYVDVMRRTALEESLQALPDRLDLVWTAGEPLPGAGTAIEGMDERRRAVLEFWASRTDTMEGRRTAEVVENWLSAVVQTSAHPITAAEREQYQARAPEGRQLPE